MSASGDGWKVASLDDMGEGPGFRKVRKELDVEAFGVNAVVIPPGIESQYRGECRRASRATDRACRR